MRKEHDVLITDAPRVRTPVKSGQVILCPFLEEGTGVVFAQGAGYAFDKRRETTGN
jgi:hypothetical protein